MTALAAKVRRILDGGIYLPGQNIRLEQLSIDTDAPLELTRSAALHLHQQGVLELVGPTPQLAREQPAANTATERIAQRLRDRIAANHYPLGAKLPTQDALARELHAGKATIGRALGVLAREGWVEHKPGRAATAALPLREVRSVRIPAAAGPRRRTPDSTPAPPSAR